MKFLRAGFCVAMLVGTLVTFFVGCGGVSDDTAKSAPEKSEDRIGSPNGDLESGEESSGDSANDFAVDDNSSLGPGFEALPTASSESSTGATRSTRGFEFESPTRDPVRVGQGASVKQKPDFFGSSNDNSIEQAFETAIEDSPSEDPNSFATEPVEVNELGSTDESRMTSVEVFYATDRNRMLLNKASMLPFKFGVGLVGVLLVCAVASLLFNRFRQSVCIAIAAGLIFVGLNHFHKRAVMRSGLAYGAERGELVKGVANVTIPKNHRRGYVERPSMLRLEFQEDQEKHVVLTQARELSLPEFYSLMNQQLSEKSGSDLLVFIHGYNVDFDSAIRRTAQLSHDLEFDCVPVCYSWPSQGTLTGYTVDENNVTWSTPHLRDFLIELAEQSNARSINVLAHSMGNRAMTTALSQLSDQLPVESLPMFNSVILAAPDVDADTFRDELAPKLAKIGRHVTLYASSHDRALEASKALHGGYPRAGESGESLVVVKEIETVDVSGVDLSLLGHSYYKVKPILQDIYQVVRDRLPAKERKGLVSKFQADSIYWHLPVPLVSESDSPRRR